MDNVHTQPKKKAVTATKEKNRAKEPKKLTSLRLSDSLRKKFQLLSIAKGQTFNDLIIEAAEQYIETEQNKKILKKFNAD